MDEGILNSKIFIIQEATVSQQRPCSGHPQRLEPRRPERIFRLPERFMRAPLNWELSMRLRPIKLQG